MEECSSSTKRAAGPEDEFTCLVLSDDNLYRKQVFFSYNFINSFGKLTSNHLKKFVIKILLKISTGWRPKRRRVNLKCENFSQIVKQFKVEGYYVVYTIDIMKEFHYEQVLKVWDILPLEEIQKLFVRLDTIFNSYTEDFINRCKVKCLDGNLEVPMSWSISHDIVRYKNINNAIFDSDSGGCEVDHRSYVENSKVNESFSLMKFYSLSAGIVNHLLSDQEGKELDLPFEVNDQEREIILFPKSSFILGRSGTGKTTVLTMKLHRKIEQYRIASNGLSSEERGMSLSNSADVSQYVGEFKGNMLHQLFVTVNPKLCFAVKQHLSRLKSFASGGQFYADKSSYDMDDIDEMAQFHDIPDTFVGIHCDKYPLVITFHKFLMMLDGSVGNSYFERFHSVRGFPQVNRSTRSVSLQTFIRTKEVNHERFCFFYWPHINEKLTKCLDPSRVFVEIMSHIKVGLQGGVSREDYVSLSDRRVSTLSAQERNAIYDVFKDYEKMKTKHCEFDLADLVMNLHFRLNNENLQGEKMDFYVDEVQDLTTTQISLFRYICKNVDEGFVFSGDTAQTIAKGVDFRFEDVRSLFYNEFVMKSKKFRFPRREKGLLSDIFILSQNFRTHSGVLKLAQSVIDLLSHFFPQSFDVLPPETSFVNGEPPIVIEPGSNENAIITVFGGSGNVDTKMVGFGAEQVILVRDDSVKKEISNYIGHQALILTIVECKGLKFQDVLLFNFFGSSPLRTQWRVVYEFLKEKDLVHSSYLNSSPSFSQLRHSVLCSELKQLYVAITRTKQRLWISETSEELFKPMFDYWKRLGLIQLRKVDDSLAKAMPRASSREEWKSQGIKDSLKIGDLLKSLESRRPKLDFFFSRFVVQNDADESNESNVSCDMEFSNSNGTNDDKKDLPVAVASGTQSMPNQASECS
ncbi:TPR and ankyrin repeat-containing protein 1 [Forsythia ovata]|uniref:TPR and ankyrin repeat-containing protein 1 n=1 Tax=Forsythia ovata TaxID=205694 RepID=A0ABD1XBU8_9LAMI